MKAVEKCENCGRVIGKLEQPYVWRKHVVCAQCHAHLGRAAPRAAPVAAPVAPLPPLPSRGAVPLPYEPAGDKRPAVMIASLVGAGVLLLLVIVGATFWAVRQSAIPAVATVVTVAP